MKDLENRVAQHYGDAGLLARIFAGLEATDPGPVPAAEPKPRLGVVIETADKRVRIVRVTKNSVAERAELAKGDVIAAAAGVEVRRNQELIAIIQRQAPGTWLPLKVRRNGRTLDIVAKFPAAFGRAK